MAVVNTQYGTTPFQKNLREIEIKTLYKAHNKILSPRTIFEKVLTRTSNHSRT